MITRRLRAGLIASVAALSIAAVSGPAHAQMDRLRSEQLRAERADGRARAAADQQPDPDAAEPGQMLINQARNLASLPYSSLQQLEQSISADPAASHPGAAYRLRRQPDRSGVLADLSAGLFRLDLLAAADRRRADPLAERARRLSGRHAGAGRRRAESRHHPHADRRAGHVEPVGHRRAAGGASRQSARRAADHATRRSHGAHRGHRARPEPGGRAHAEAQEQAQAQTNNFLNYGSGYQPGTVQMFH